MRYFAQGFILFVGFTLAIVAATAESTGPTVADCFNVNASSAPTICK